MTAEQVAAQENILRDSSPLGLMGEPEDIANLALYLAADAASKYLTGSCVTADGGTLWAPITVAK